MIIQIMKQKELNLIIENQGENLSENDEVRFFVY